MGAVIRLTDEQLHETVELTKTLVSIPTESPEGEGYAELVNVLEKELRQRVPVLETEQLVVPREVYDEHPEIRDRMREDRVILLVRWPAPGRPKIHINDHYDVVSAGDHDRWTVCPPYSPRVVGDRLYGRGSCDPKGSVAAFVHALQIIYERRLPLQYDMTISFTPDEEVVGGYTGLHYLVDETRRGRPYIEGDFFLSLDGPQNYISLGKTGIVSFRIEIFGSPSHISRPFTGRNALHLVQPVLAALLQLRDQVERRVSKYEANAELPLVRLRPNLSITCIRGGGSMEVVPDRAVIEGIRAVTADESPTPMEDAVDELVTTILAVRQQWEIPMKLTVKPLLPPYVTDADHPAVVRYRRVAGRSRGLYPAAVSEGYNDIAVVAAGLGMPVIARGVQREGCNVHAYDENVPLESLRVGVEDLVAFLTQD